MVSASRFLFMLVVMALLLPAWSGDNITTAEQAIKRAQLFVSKVGWTTTAKPVAAFPAPHGFTHAWSVEYPKRGECNETVMLRIDRKSGQIESAVNFGALNRLPAGDKVTITTAQANAAAEKVLALAGISMQSLKLSQSQPECHTAPPQDQQWSVRYQRIHAGYAFAHDSVVVNLHPLNASLLSYKASLRSPVPKSLKVVITEMDAKKIAENYLAGKGHAIRRIASAKLLIVQPNHYYEKTKPAARETVTRLAWVIHCIRQHEPIRLPDGTTKAVEGDDHFADVWIDAETGKVLGGMACR
ncbi:MAG TPA: hypothetical protein PLZ36_14660 [Armatimonadota bacterium]|nr:hypothetical protein [Armatimonadota bacterium]HOS42868.1 hypothetical protein [Armatimonadota bacterium]